MAHYEEFTIDQRSDVAIELHLVDENGAAKDLTNYSVAASLKRNYNSATEYSFTALVANPSTDGIVTLSLTSSGTDAIPAGRYIYDTFISFVDSAGDTIREKVLEGRMDVVPNITSFGGVE